MIDMKRPKPKKSDGKEDAVPSQMHEEYPYGLRVSLENEEIKKLKLDVSKMKVGQKCTITAEAEITRLEQSEMKGEPDRDSVSYQIKSMEITMSKPSSSYYKGNRK